MLPYFRFTYTYAVPMKQATTTITKSPVKSIYGEDFLSSVGETWAYFVFLVGVSVDNITLLRIIK